MGTPNIPHCEAIVKVLTALAHLTPEHAMVVIEDVGVALHIGMIAGMDVEAIARNTQDILTDFKAEAACDP